MDSALGWIGQLVAWFGQFIPRWAIVPTTHAGVKWKYGHTPSLLEPGVHWWWPLTSLLVLYPVVRQTVTLESQVMFTTDEKAVPFNASVVVTYTVHDLLALLTTCHDPDEVVAEVGQIAVFDVLSKKTWEALTTDDLKAELTSTVQVVLEPFGFTVVQAAVTELTQCKVLKLLQNNS